MTAAHLCRNAHSHRVHIRKSRYTATYLCEVAARRPVGVLPADLEKLTLCGGCGAEALLQGILTLPGLQVEVGNGTDS